MKTSLKIAALALGLVVNSTPSFSQWSLTGNASTNPASNYVGTSDETALVLRTYNTPRLEISSSGDLDWKSGLSAGNFFYIDGTKFMHLQGGPYGRNTFIGLSAGNVIDVGDGNTAVGYQSAEHLTDGTCNTLVGARSGRALTTAIRNTFIGNGAGMVHTSGNHNTHIGNEAGTSDLTGEGNTFIGNQSATYNESGSYNTFLGTNTGYVNIDGERNTLIGYQADVSEPDLINATAIGADVIVEASHSMVFGNGDVTKWGFGVNAGSGKAIEVGIVNLTPGNGAYLDNAGDWYNPSDRNLKENITAMNYRDILSKINKLEITQWNYKIHPGVKHIGPMAQDFYALFNLGNNDRSISTIDPAGVALACVKGLKLENDELRNEVQELKSQIADIRSLLQNAGIKTEGKTNIISEGTTAYVEQNIPNPFVRETQISYFVPNNYGTATLSVYNNHGELVKTYTVDKPGAATVSFTADNANFDQFYYTFVVDEKVIATKKMIGIK